MTLQEFLNKYLGKTKGYPDDNQFLGQCLSIVKLYIKECFGVLPPPSGTNSAYGYWSNFPNPLGEVFDKVENTPDLIPQEGWIAIWKPWTSNIYGHIAIVASGSTTGTLKNYAQNWTSKVFQLESNRYTNVIGFLKPIKEDNMTDLQKNALDILQNAVDTIKENGQPKYGNIESAARALSDLVRDNKEYKKHIKVQENANLALAQQVEMAQANVKTLSDSIVEKDEAFRLATAEIGQKNLKITELENIIAGYQTAPPSANDLTSWELLKLLIKKLWQTKK